MVCVGLVQDAHSTQRDPSLTDVRMPAHMDECLGAIVICIVVFFHILLLRLHSAYTTLYNCDWGHFSFNRVVACQITVPTVLSLVAVIINHLGKIPTRKLL